MMKRMKGSALLLLLCFAALQLVSITRCPCDTLCGHKNACEEENGEGSRDDCCSQSREASGHRHGGGESDHCFHLEPQTDLDGPTAVDVSAPGPLLDPVLVPKPLLPMADYFPRPLSLDLSPPARDGPLFLQHSALLL
jgi:hypothetical protein